MLPHHEAAGMSHEQSRPLTPPPYNVAASDAVQQESTLSPSTPGLSAIDEKQELAKSIKAVGASDTTDVESGSVVDCPTGSSTINAKPTTTLFEVVYRRTMLVSAVLAIPLFLNLIFSRVASQEWIDANLYLAAKAFGMTVLHLVAMIYRVLLRHNKVKREKGAVPWFLDGMYAFFHAACLALHYWCALQGVQALSGGDGGEQEITIYTIEVIHAGIHV